MNLFINKFVITVLILLLTIVTISLTPLGHFTYNALLKYNKKIYSSVNKKIEKCRNFYYKKVGLSTHIDKIENDSWRYYKKHFITEDGRVIDPQRGYITTSEGQGYAMRRSLFMNDKETFDNVYNWTKYNLKRKHDHLFGWLWGQKNLGKQSKIEYGIIDQNGATDAGTEIAVALIFASKIWCQESYKDDALQILNDIWNKETVEIKGERILASGITQCKCRVIDINPSYFTIARFRVFAEVDKAHNWQRIIDSSYRLTNYCLDHIPSGLPPDLFYIDRKTGKITFEKDKSDFSYDAVRMFYRFYVDYTISGDPRAKKLLSRSIIFRDRWVREGTFYTNYKQDGELKDLDQPIGSIAIILPAMRLYDKKVADEIYQQCVQSQYHREGYWDDPMNYYEQNLVWFGNWLYKNEKNLQAFKY